MFISYYLQQGAVEAKGTTLKPPPKGKKGSGAR